MQKDKECRGEESINNNNQSENEESEAESSLEEEFSLPELQDRIKRDKTLYLPEFKQSLQIYSKIKDQMRDLPAKEHPKLIEYLKFFAHISHVFPEELEFLKDDLVLVLEEYYDVLHINNRNSIIFALTLLRNKNQISPIIVTPLFVKLLKCKDKKLREELFGHIIGDTKRLNKGKSNIQINTQLQSFMYNLIQTTKDKSTKGAMHILVELYKRGIWRDAKTVNAISEGCLNKNSKISAIGCKFFLCINFPYSQDVESGDEQPEEEKNKLMQDLSKKLPMKKKVNMRKALKLIIRRESRKSKIKYTTDFFPIDLLYDAQGFTEKLFRKLRRSNDKFELKLLMIQLIARLIGRHELLIGNYYPFLQRYLLPHQKEVMKIMAALSESAHALVLPEDVRPLLKKILDGFITERATPENITLGLNTVREVCSRMPLAVNKELLDYMVNFRSFRNKNVVQAAKSLINLFRDINPGMLEKKYRGYQRRASESGGVYGIYGENKVVEGREEGIADHIAKNIILSKEQIEKLKLIKMDRENVGLGQIKRGEEKDITDIIHHRVNLMKERMFGVENKGVLGKRKMDESRARGDEEIKDINSDGEESDAEEGSDIELSEGEWEEVEDMDENLPQNENSYEDEDTEGIIDLGKEDQMLDDTSKQSTQNITQLGIIPNIYIYIEVMEMLDRLKGSGDEGDNSEEDIYTGQNFVDPESLNTFKKTKKEKLQQQRKEEGKKGKEKFKPSPRQKGGGSTNIEKLKNKPYMMLLPKKKIKSRDNFQSVKEKIKKLKQGLKKVRKGKIKVRQSKKLKH